MKINSLHIIISSYLHKFSGGCETWLDYFLENIDSQNKFNKIYVYHFKSSETFENIPDDYLENVNIEFVSIPSVSNKKGKGFLNIVKYTFFTYKRIKRKFNKGDIILLIGSTYVALVGILLRRKFRESAKIITWIRSIAVEELKSRGSGFSKLASVLEKNILKTSDEIIANGSDTASRYRMIYPKYASKINVIENAVKMNSFENIKTPDFRNDKINITYMGRLSKAKGFDYFIETVNYFYEKYDCRDRVNFRVYGHGELEDMLNSNVTYKGKYSPNKVASILQDNHVIVFLNDSQAAGGVSHGILETMAASRLCIAWDKPVHSQILNESNSILVQDKNITELASVFKEILEESNIGSLEKKCICAKEEARQYSVEKHIEKFIHLLE